LWSLTDTWINQSVDQSGAPPATSTDYSINQASKQALVARCVCRERFHHTILLLLVVAGACAMLTGIRGGLFTVAMSRLNVRIRRALFHSLLQVCGLLR
jgi:hypothetical protein